MLFIGNQIRLTRAILAAAVRQRRGAIIGTLARQQVEAGAGWLLVDMGPQRRGADDDLAWLVRTIHDEVCVPLVLRSDDPQALKAGLQVAKDKVLIDATLPGASDSASPGGQSIEPYLSLADRYQAKIAISACPSGLPTPTEERLALVSETLLPKALDAGLALPEVYVDPLVPALTCDQPLVPATVETLRLLKVAADPAPNTLVHLEDVADGVADGAKPYVTQGYVTMLLAAGLDALVANVLDPDLMETIRVVRERDIVTGYDRLLLRLYDVTKADVELDVASIDSSDLDQVSLFKTYQILTNKLIYADSYLQA
jgi:5-methyltetrahydrofolate corrinoid/iron sulfur protein methyltransferase